MKVKLCVRAVVTLIVLFLRVYVTYVVNFIQIHHNHKITPNTFQPVRIIASTVVLVVTRSRNLRYAHN